MSKHDQKKEAILLAGMDVMKRRGYNGTSVKDIVEAAGVPKGSFYNYFESKEVFALDALDYAASQGQQTAEAILGNRDIAPLARLQGYFENTIERACSAEFKEGCFIGNMCQEMADTSDTIRAAVNRKLKQLRNLIAETITEANNAGKTNRSVDPQQAAEFILNAWEGAIMRAKAAQCREPLDAFLAMLPIIL